MRAGRGILIVVDLTVQLIVGNGSDRVVPIREEIWYVYIYHFRSHGTRHLRDTRPVSSHCDPAALFAVIDTILHCDVVGEVEEWRSSGGGVEVEWRSSGGLVHGEYAEMRWRREESGDKIMEVGGGLTEVMHFLRQNSRQILKYRNWPSAGEVRAADLILIGIEGGQSVGFVLYDHDAICISVARCGGPKLAIMYRIHLAENIPKGEFKELLLYYSRVREFRRILRRPCC